MKSAKLIAILFILPGLLFISACKKDKKTAEEEVEEIDRIKPTLTLMGAADMEILYGESVEDPGASAVDNKDGDLSAKIISTWKERVDVNKTGTCTVEYSVADLAGNKSTVTRKVSVKRIASSYSGEYSSYTINSGGTTAPFSATVSSVFNSNQLVIYPFGGFDPTLIVNISGTFGDQLSFSQNIGNNTLSGTGTITESGKVITLNYRITSSSSVQDNQQVLTRKKID